MVTTDDIAAEWTFCYRLALMYTYDRTLSEDIAQQAVMKAIQAIESFTYGKLQTWLGVIVYHEVATYKGKNNRFVQEIEEDDPGMKWGATPAVQEDRVMVNELLRIADKLPYHHGEKGWKSKVIRLTALGYADSEIGATLGIPRGTVKSRVWRARNELMEAMQ